MPRTNQDGRSVKLVLEWLCKRNILDGELSTALDIPPTTYSRRRDADDYPSFEELERYADHFGLCRRALQIAFGLRDRDEVVLLDADGIRQYVEQGGDAPHFQNRGTIKTTAADTQVKRAPNRRRQRRPDAPPGP